MGLRLKAASGMSQSALAICHIGCHIHLGQTPRCRFTNAALLLDVQLAPERDFLERPAATDTYTLRVQNADLDTGRRHCLRSIAGTLDLHCVFEPQSGEALNYG